MRRAARDQSRIPYLVLAISPALTLPLSLAILGSVPDCGEDEPWWELGNFELALLPGLADFLPFAWLASRAPPVRRAAFIAGLTGAVRFAVPQVLTVLYQASSGGQASNSNCTISTHFVLGLVPVMLALWAACVVIAVVMVRRSRPGQVVPPD